MAFNRFKTMLRIEVERSFPVQRRGRPPLLTFDEAYESILKVTRTGMQWRELQPKNVSFITVFKTMHKWIAADLFRIVYRRLLRLYARSRRPRYYCVDSSFVKNVYGTDCIGRNPTDRGRMATKLSTIVDDRGTPFALLCTPANQSDMRLLEPTLEGAMATLAPETRLYADKGYDSAYNRQICHRRGLRDRIFRRRTINGRRTHAMRGVVERFFAWIDKYRRLILRYERHVAVYESLTLLAFGQLIETRF